MKKIFILLLPLSVFASDFLETMNLARYKLEDQRMRIEQKKEILDKKCQGNSMDISIKFPAMGAFNNALGAGDNASCRRSEELSRQLNNNQMKLQKIILAIQMYTQEQKNANIKR